ncbi:MAG: hypothetical protein R3C53_12490 [Pirellulaceae bacterium]
MRAHQQLLIILMAWFMAQLGFAGQSLGAEAVDDTQPVRNLLYVATPGVRNYLEYGGHGLLVFDMDREHDFVKRIPLGGLDDKGSPINVKGVCANAKTGRIYVSTIKSLMCVDLVSEQLLWERELEGGCDRMSISPDGQFIYQPSFEGPHWLVLDADGQVLAKVVPDSGAHNTVVGLDGSAAYLAGLRSPLLSISDTTTHQLSRTVGPFSSSIRPFTVNGSQTRCYVCVNDLLGFEIGDITTGKKLYRIEVQGFERGKVKRHGCPEPRSWANSRRARVLGCRRDQSLSSYLRQLSRTPRQLKSITLADEPGWITFSLDGRWAYPSTGQVIDVASHKIVKQLTDEHGAAVQSEKMVQVVFEGDRPIATGDQFGLGRIR